MSRGKLLHSGMTSLSSFQPAADRFCSWLSDVESNIDILEAAGDKLRIKYKDKQIPEAELTKFKVSGNPTFLLSEAQPLNALITPPPQKKPKRFITRYTHSKSPQNATFVLCNIHRYLQDQIMHICTYM
jgi:hypothetical protein